MAQAKRYQEWERAQAVQLAAQLGSVRGAGIRLKIPTQTLRTWVREAAARSTVEGGEANPATPTEQAAVGYLTAAAENVRVSGAGGTDDSFEAGAERAGSLDGWRGFGSERRRIQGLVDGWIRQQEEAQLTASKLMEIVRWSLSPVKHDDLKALALALKSITEMGQAGADKHLDYVHGRGQKGAQVDARSYTLSQVWGGIQEDRARSRLAGRAGSPTPEPAPLPPGIITTPAPPTYPTPHPDG